MVVEMWKWRWKGMVKSSGESGGMGIYNNITYTLSPIAGSIKL